jgi:predicted phosphodiesterase
MTKLAVFSDIHANLPALEAVVEDSGQFAVDRVLVAGDVINFGPFTWQVVKRVVENGWTTVRGNGELFLLDYGTPRAPEAWDDPIAYPIPGWLNRQVDAGLKAAVAAWPETMRMEFPDAPPIRLLHGAPTCVNDPLYPTLTDEELTGFLEEVEESTLIAGHTHLPMDRTVSGWHLLNPGSVGVPLDGEFTASYMLLEGDERGWQAAFRRVPFPYKPLFDEFERLGFIEECGVVGQLFVDIFRTARPHVVSFMRWKAGAYPDEALNHEMYAEYRAKCKWWEYNDRPYLINRYRES